MNKHKDFINKLKMKTQASVKEAKNKFNEFRKNHANDDIKEYCAMAKSKLSEHKKIVIPVAAVIVALTAVWVFASGKSQPAPQPIQIQQITPEKIALEQALRKNMALAHKLAALSNAKPSESDQYLKSINNMSMELNYLTLQNQIMKQKLDLSSTITSLKKSGVTDIPAISDDGFMDGGSLLGGGNQLKIAIIYKQNGQYYASINLGNTTVTVKDGAQLNDQYRVQQITNTTVSLIGLKDHKLKVLSIANQMRSI